LIRAFHDRQNEFYAGGEQGPAAEFLAEDVVWHVPGRSALAGEHRGRDEVLRYFASRRDLARASFRITVRDVLAGEDRAVVFAHGEVRRDGRDAHWETAAIFRVVDGRIAECWALPYDQYRFDEIWAR
jgi:hypothetical protein